MSPASKLNGLLEAACTASTQLPLPIIESLPAVSSSQSGSSAQYQWLEALPLMAFIEHGQEIVAANDLTRRTIGSSESIRTDEILLGAYPRANGLRRQRFDCLLSPLNGMATLVSGVVQSFEAAGDNARLLLLMEPLEDDADRVGRNCSQQRGTFLQEIFDTASEAMVVLQEERVLSVNKEFVRIFGYPVEACLGKPLLDLIIPEGRMHETEMLMHTVETECRASMETVRHTSTGEMLDVSVTLSQVQLGNGRSGQLATYRDIRHEKRLQAQLQHTALHDPVTGLANRVLFLDRLTLTLSRQRRRPDRNFAVVFLDLDQFKQINDTWGHAAGDTLLLSVAKRLRSCLRPQDTVARFGGDEFALVLDETGSVEEIDCLIHRIQNELQRPVDIDGGEIFVSASMGIVLGSLAYNNIEDILRDADAAMYRAKDKGRARHEFFTLGMPAKPL
jgi:diguanylate cyclase (GGDEF)-like protein/PAS domain S-box-containing protein